MQQTKTETAIRYGRYRDGRSPFANESGTRRRWSALAVRLLFACLLLPTAVFAQVALPVELIQDRTDTNYIFQSAFNFQSAQGVPLSDIVGVPPGSDGRGPTGALPATSNQFSSLVSFGGGGTPGAPTTNALQKLPAAESNGQVLMVLQRVQIGAPYLNRRSSFSFGSTIPPPLVDYAGELLPDSAEGISYWRAEPYSANLHENADYYWSPHANQVYAVQPGPVFVTWQKSVPFPVGSTPTYVNELGVALGIPNFYISGANAYALKTESYVVSGSPVKTPRKMYWTQGSFRKIGKPISIPGARIGAVKVAYNNTTFKRTVDEEFVSIGDTSPAEGNTNAALKELRTLWYDKALEHIYAYNQEGRVFVEFLGDLKTDNVNRDQIGFEIVDVIRQATPTDKNTELGERIHPSTPGSIEDLFPEPILQISGDSFDYQHSVEGANFLELYAARETENLNDYIVHWMEEGVAGIRWPRHFTRYRLHWPLDVGRYSHYIRPAAATDAEAQMTGVSLKPESVPFISFQDSLDRPRAKITAESKFYTWLDATHPAHRTLLRFTAGDSVAFERVFSWLDTTLPSVIAYEEAYGTYQDAAKRGVNGEWKLFVTDDAGQDSGTIASWTLEVVTRHPETRELRSQEFRSLGGLILNDSGNASPYPSSITVSGILNPVLKVRVRLSGVTHTYPSDIDAFLMGPNGNVCILMSDVGAGGDINNLTLVFDDDASSLMGETSANNGTYLPTDYTDQYGGDSPPPSGGTLGISLAALLDLLPVEPVSPIAPIAVRSPWPSDFEAPRIVQETVEVGERIMAPQSELGGDPEEDYLAGYLNLAVGTSYDPTAYIDPLNAGFSAANQGAIIPVNAIPSDNELEVWWFRRTSSRAGANAGDGSKGFSQIAWPSAIGRYALQWPTEPREIVMASKLGGERLSPLEAQGIIYTQNDPDADGYNPNEEHAIMSGGTPFATRDDLNNTNAIGYSSHPYVLVSYTESDSRPAITPFKVLREKPSAGYVFDYIVPAGQLLQPPPPLTFLPKPVEGSGDNAVDYNTEPSGVSGDLPVNWNEAHDANGRFGNYKGFTYRDRKQNFWVYRGPHAGRPALQAGRYIPATGAFGALTTARVLRTVPFRHTMHVSRQDQYLEMTSTNLPAWLEIEHLSLVGTPGPTETIGDVVVTLLIEDRYDRQQVSINLTLQVLASTGTMLTQLPLVIQSDNPYTGASISFSNRPPFLALSPNVTNSFTMQYYYKTQDDFAWPGISNPPESGSIVPYLRPRNPANGNYIGDAASKNTESLQIVYRPVWPVADPKNSAKPLPTLPFGATLALPGYELPGVRDWTTAHVLYQQSIAADMTATNYSAVLYDPTVNKTSDLLTHGMERIPGGIKTETLLGRVYFSNLPPHLGKRLYMDPNRGTNGALVLTGEFKLETLGDHYLHLNLLRGRDLLSAKGLCPIADPDYGNWVKAIEGLSVEVATYYEDPSKPGNFIARSSSDDLLRIEALYYRSFTNQLAATFTNAAERIEESRIRAQARIADYVSSLSVETAFVGDVVEIKNDNVPRDSYALSATGPGEGYITMLESSGTAFTEPGDPVAMHVFFVGGPDLYRGELKIIASANPLSELITFQHTADLAGRADEFDYEWKIAAPVDGFPPVIDATMSRYLALDNGPELPRYTLGGAGIQALGDNYVVMRYRPTETNHPLYNVWSRWTVPTLAEGWIKRVLAGINPFNQRITDLFNNRVNTDVSILTQAGQRWEGDIALNLETINNYGLIEIYETVLRRGRSLSIESGFNYGPANDALLLAAGYINDLYMMLGNEAWADAANPTIGIGTADNTYGDIATALFSFKGQQASLLDEELALLRGRDDVFQPGVEVRPIYNRLIWNYTRGIDAGEVIYALNYNIQENPDAEPDGNINAEDAARMYPQGHGDAYGHYLTAVKGYLSLLLNSKFDWVPRIEAVNVLGKAVSVDYQDERKFAAAAAALARAGRQVFDLTWRKDYAQVDKVGWEHFADERINTQRSFQGAGNTTNHPARYWGMDQWASRVGQGTYLNWVVGNSMVPAVDPDPNHEGIQKVDRSTVPELKELPTLASGLQTALDNAEAGFSPLGVPQDAIALDISPVLVTSSQESHFEQIFNRATAALRNALVAFDDARDVTRLMRSEQDSLADLQNRVVEQELAFRNAMIELYGTPYADDMGPGKTWKQDYSGPDTMHYMYIETPELPFAGLWNYPGEITESTWSISLADLPTDWGNNYYHSGLSVAGDDNFSSNPTLDFNVGPHGYFEKPSSWDSRRASPGSIQQAISGEVAAYAGLLQAIYTQTATKASLDRLIGVFNAEIKAYDEIRERQEALLIADEVLEKAKFANDLWQKYQDSIIENVVIAGNSTSEALPKSLVVGIASGGDMTFAGRAAIKAAGLGFKKGLETVSLVRWGVINALETFTSTAKRWEEFDKIQVLDRGRDQRAALIEIGNFFENMQDQLWGINVRLRQYDDAQRAVRALVAKGDRIQEEREIFRKRSSAIVQGFRTRDAAFRIFRNEKLERYKTLFDLTSKYALLAANAYDYETGLLGTDAGHDFVQRIIRSRALGVVGPDGEPQFAGSNTGDPGLSSALAEMKADWDVVRTRLGFNNPDGYGTTVSLRSEHFRILPGEAGDTTWRQMLHRARVRDVLEDADVRRYCMQISNGDGLPVPGIVLDFRTTITDGLNLLGNTLAAGDHALSPSAFATKIYAIGIALEGYKGMSDPSTEGSPEDPDLSFLDPDALSATPYVYLVPVGIDSMRSPPLGDTSVIRTWNVQDIAIPMPFNIGASGFSVAPLYQSNDSLFEPLFTTRKHQSFRAVSDASLFSPDIYDDGGRLAHTQFTNSRLIGRSVWNSHWKLVIPGKTLLGDANEGLDRLIKSLEDVKINFVTYSYSGN